MTPADGPPQRLASASHLLAKIEPPDPYTGKTARDRSGHTDRVRSARRVFGSWIRSASHSRATTRPACIAHEGQGRNDRRQAARQSDDVLNTIELLYAQPQPAPAHSRTSPERAARSERRPCAVRATHGPRRVPGLHYLTFSHQVPSNARATLARAARTIDRAPTATAWSAAPIEELRLPREQVS